MLNKLGEVVLEGSRSSNNCYKLIQSHTCHTTSLDKIDSWHQKLGHLKFKNLTRILNTCVVRGIPVDTSFCSNLLWSHLIPSSRKVKIKMIYNAFLDVEKGRKENCVISSDLAIPFWQ